MRAGTLPVRGAVKPSGAQEARQHYGHEGHWRETMRGILLWVLGIPLPVIILLYLLHVI